MRVDRDRTKTIRENIVGRKMASFEDILELLSCSSITLRRDLKMLGAITSYTHNGRFLTLPDIPQFNGNGLWFFRKVGFSRFGNSLKTIIGIIDGSKNGFTREEIEAIMKIGISKQIQILLEREAVYRIKLGNKYLYLPEGVMRNKKRKLRLIGTRQAEECFEKGVEIKDIISLLKAVLMEKEVGFDAESIARISKKYSLTLPAKKIERLLVKYDLPVKKTQST